MESIWLTYAKKLHALATTGIEFTQSDYDRERYEEIQKISQDMFARLTKQSPALIEQLMLAHVQGYETPKVDVRAAVVKGDKILLVQEKTDKRWALPGGYADVGYSASENVIKEVREEAGIDVRVSRLYAVRHKAKGAYDPDLREFYKLFFLCETVNDDALAPGSEVQDAAYFSLDALPELSTGRVIREDLEAAFQYRDNSEKPTYFDEGDFLEDDEV